MDALTSKLYECHKSLLQNGVDVTADVLRNEFTVKGERPRLLVEIFKDHNEQMKKLIGKGYAKPTLTKFKTTLSHLQGFLKWMLSNQKMNAYFKEIAPL